MVVDVTTLVPDHLREAIKTPHAYENDKTKRPVWLIWKTFVIKDRPGLPESHRGLVYGPYLDSVCDSEDSALYHVGALFESSEYGRTADQHIFVERIPCNHRFASSLENELAKLKIETEVPRYQYKRTGD